MLGPLTVGALAEVAGLRVGFDRCGALGLAAAALIVHRQHHLSRPPAP